MQVELSVNELHTIRMALGDRKDWIEGINAESRYVGELSALLDKIIEHETREDTNV